MDGGRTWKSSSGGGAAAELVIVIVDASARGWAALDASATGAATADTPRTHSSFREFQSALESFLCAFASLSRQNRVAVLAHNDEMGGFIMPSSLDAPASALPGGADFIRSADVRSSLRVLDSLRYKHTPGDPALQRLCPAYQSMAACISLAVCYQSKQRQQFGPGLHSRILLFQAAPDIPADYIAVINAVYSAQRSGVVIDSVMLSAPTAAGAEAPPSVFLQQASYLTGGHHAHPGPDQHRNLLAYLIFLFSSDSLERQKLLLPPPHNVDLRAHCFCHRQHRTIAWVCSTCLSIYCAYSESCAMCGATARGALPAAAAAPK